MGDSPAIGYDPSCEFADAHAQGEVGNQPFNYCPCGFLPPADPIVLDSAPDVVGVDIEDMIRVIYRVAVKIEPLIEQAPEALAQFAPLVEKLQTNPMLKMLFGGK